MCILGKSTNIEYSQVATFEYGLRLRMQFHSSHSNSVPKFSAHFSCCMNGCYGYMSNLLTVFPTQGTISRVNSSEIKCSVKILNASIILAVAAFYCCMQNAMLFIGISNIRTEYF